MTLLVTLEEEEEERGRKEVAETAAVVNELVSLLVGLLVEATIFCLLFGCCDSNEEVWSVC